jgi:hypothetical protein
MSRKRTRAQRRGSLRDNAWGIALGLVFAGFLGALFLGGGITGTDAATCDKPLSPMAGGNDLTAAGFASEDESLGAVIEYLNADDRANADAVFFGPVHSFTHNVDPIVRATQPEVAKALCNAVIRLENDLAVPGTPAATLAKDTIAVREALRDSAVALGHPRPGEASQ